MNAVALLSYSIWLPARLRQVGLRRHRTSVARKRVRFQQSTRLQVAFRACWWFEEVGLRRPRRLHPRESSATCKLLL